MMSTPCLSQDLWCASVLVRVLGAFALLLNRDQRLFTLVAQLPILIGGPKLEHGSYDLGNLLEESKVFVILLDGRLVGLVGISFAVRDASMLIGSLITQDVTSFFRAELLKFSVTLLNQQR